MDLYLIRHGQSVNNVGIIEVEEPPLTDLGFAQADNAGRWLSGSSFQAIYCSPMLRALQTAEVLSRHLRISPRVRANLGEYVTDANYAGMPRAQIERFFPNFDLPDNLTESGWWHGAFEDDAATYRRAEDAARMLREIHEPTRDRVAVVTHGTFGSALISVLLGAPPCGYGRFSLNNVSITLLNASNGCARMRYHNFTGHLPDNQIT